MAVDDPKPNIGSGSATLNALISVTECLAAREGHKVRQCCCARSRQLAELFLTRFWPMHAGCDSGGSLQCQDSHPSPGTYSLCKRFMKLVQRSLFLQIL